MIRIDDHATARCLRERLLPLWEATHLGWDDGPVPQPLSRFMCRYTAELIALLDPRWQATVGLVDGETHVWSEREPDSSRAGDVWCLDLTGDQFGRLPVLLVSPRPDGYVPFRWTDSDPAVFRARARRWLNSPSVSCDMTPSRRWASARPFTVGAPTDTGTGTGTGTGTDAGTERVLP